MSIGNLPEMLSQRIFVGTTLVGRLGVEHFKIYGGSILFVTAVIT